MTVIQFKPRPGVRSPASSPQPSSWLTLVVVAAAGLLGFGAFAFREPISAAISSECQIRANVSSAGERIYHVPGQRYYADTVVHWWRGERWFCSEADAQSAGWRRARA